MVSPFQQPDFTSDSGTQYKTNLDNAIAVFLRMAGAFSPQAQDTPDMTVHVTAGHVFDGSTLTEVAAQSTGSITAPSSDDRIDRVVISETDGSVSVITGSEAASPSAPSVTSGNLPCAQVYLTPSTTQIGNSMITDERSRVPFGAEPYSASNVPASTDLSDHEFAVVELDGAFDAGEEVRCERIGNWVTITGVGSQLTHSSDASPSTTGAPIPAAFRPTHETQDVYANFGDISYAVAVFSNGDLSTYYKSLVDGTDVARTNTSSPPTITYLIT